MKDAHKNEKWLQMAIRRREHFKNTPFPKLYPKKWDFWTKEITRLVLELLEKNDFCIVQST